MRIQFCGKHRVNGGIDAGWPSSSYKINVVISCYSGVWIYLRFCAEQRS